MSLLCRLGIHNRVRIDRRTLFSHPCEELVRCTRCRRCWIHDIILRKHFEVRP